MVRCWLGAIRQAITWTIVASDLLPYGLTGPQWVNKNFHTWFLIGWQQICQSEAILTHWGRVTHMCVSKLTIIDSDNGLSPGRRQAIIWTNAGILLIGPLGTNFSEILNKIYTFSFKKMYLKMLSGKLQPFCLGKWIFLSNPHPCFAAKLTTQIARLMGPTWVPSGVDRTQVDPMLAPWILLSG